MKEITNFWEVILDYEIEIPIIQRDYAQGRQTTKINEIRKKIINDMFISLTGGNKLEFDFVYGNIESRDSSNIFIPLDGQQRLTTLFLLHWYLAIQSGNLDDIKILNRFTYETRTSSREFCNALVENVKGLPAFTSNNLISKVIKNASWFFLSWIKDPTIKSMLVMLDDIHTMFFSRKELWPILTDINKCPIVFRFVKLEDFGLEDDLYIKMNARGKALTDFENFKAKFEKYINQYYPNRLSDFSYKIDGNWIDMFWSPPENARFDDKYYNFFKAVAINNYALRVDTSKAKIQEQFANITASPSALLEQVDESFLDDICVLDVLPNVAKESIIEFKKVKILDLFQEIIKSSQPTYFNRIMFYAISRFLNKTKSIIDKQALTNWIRIIYNLCKNTEYDEFIEYARSIKSIDELVKNAEKILQYFSDPTTIIQGFNNSQIEEERVKSSLILKSPEWALAIYKAENHGYFDGQIGFILSFARIINENSMVNIAKWTDKESETYLESFTDYYNKSSVIFGNEGLLISDFLWERALLCKGYYWIGRGDRVSLLLNAHRDYSWKRLLRETDNFNKKRDYVKQVLDCVSADSVFDDLQKIVIEHNVTDIRKFFIDEPKIIEVCNGRFIQKYGDTYLLLRTSITAGYHKELKSYSLYLKIRKLCKCSANCHCTEYLEQCGINNPKMITKVNNNQVQISYGNGKYILVYNDMERRFETEIDIIEALKEEGIITC